MPRKQIPIYATQNDFAGLLREVSNNRPLEIVIGGLSNDPTRLILSDFENIEPFKTYLVFEQGMRVEVRAVAQRDGGHMYAVDQIGNPHSVVLQCGGVFDEHRLIASQLGTVGTSKQSGGIYSLFAKAICKKFEKIQSYYVGPEAVGMLDSGARLAPTVKSPKKYDLVRPQ